MIYVCGIEGHPFLKVGYSENPQKRYATLATVSPFPIYPIAERNGTRYLEKNIHAACEAHRVNGEWFEDCEQVWSAFFREFDPYPNCKNRKDIFRLKTREKCERLLMFTRTRRLTLLQKERVEEYLNPWAQENGKLL